MTDSKDGSENAFPSGYMGAFVEPAPGLTKREYFAAMAMQGLAHNASVYDVGYLVKKSVEVADALLSALDKESGATTNRGGRDE